MIKDVPMIERPREKAIQYGVDSLSNRELLALLIRHGSHGVSSLDIADEILQLTPGFSDFSKLTINDLIKIKGISKIKANELLACIEIMKRMSFQTCLKKDVIQDPLSLVKWLNLEIGSSLQEMFLVVYLNTQNQIIHHEILFKGTLETSMIHPREIFKVALLHSSSKIVVVHNHPSGNLVPSVQDIHITEQLIEISNLLQIEIMDHLIVSNMDYFSFKKAGLL